MSNRSPRSKLFEWRITRIRSTPAAFIAEQAIEVATSEYGIKNPHQQARLAAQRVREIG